ncbi:MAG TPA: hypothetical protein VFS89_03780 [Nitrosospira sp.]|nr:hypothetical protein [Nitrosospira sp.]
MAIDLGASNTTRYHTVPDHSDFTLPNTDWTWLALVYPQGTADNKYIVSTGAYGAADAINLVVYNTGAGLGVATKITTYSEVATATPVAHDKWNWVYATRRAGLLYTGQIEVGTSSAVESTGLTIFTAVDGGTGPYIGTRADLTANRFWKGRWSQVAFVSGSGITAAQAVELAQGAPLFGMPFASKIKFLLHGKTAAYTTLPAIIGNHAATRNGSSFGTNEEDTQTPYIWAPLYALEGPATSSPVTGTLAYTNANDTLAASGKTTVVGTLAVTNASDTVSATGTTTVTGSLAVTNANDTVSATGSPVIVGSLATTNADDTLSASGAVGSAISGTLAVTNADDTVAASGTTTVTGALAYTNAGDTLAATGSTTVTGTLAATNANDTLAASGTAGAGEVIGTLDVVNADDTVAASGTTKILGTLTYTNANDTLSAFGTVNNGVMVEAALITGTATSSGIKKPGIPENAPAWLRTTLEILEGRRGNRVTIPAAANLTFSATPTQAECEALYEYTNDIRTALSSIISRFDS